MFTSNKIENATEERKSLTTGGIRAYDFLIIRHVLYRYSTIAALVISLLSDPYLDVPRIFMYLVHDTWFSLIKVSVVIVTFSSS